MTRRTGAGGRTVRALAVAAVAVLALSGCAAASDPSWTPPGWGADAVAFTTAPEPIDAATVASLTPQRLRNDAVGVQGRVALLPGAAPMNDRMLRALRDAVAARSAATGTAYTPQVFARGAGMGDRGCVRGSTLRPAAEVLADPALGAPGGTGTAVVCDVVAAAGPVLGERVRTVAGGPGGVDADTSDIVYTDVTTGTVATAAELWTPAAPAALWAAIVEKLRREAGALSLAPVAAPDEAALAAFAPALATTVPAPDGSLVITVPAGFTAPEVAELGVAPTAEPLTVGVPAALASTLTTPVGAALVAAMSTAAPYQAPAVVPAGREPVDCTLFPCMALTYDDGPSDATAGMLDVLAQRHAAATFFVMGEKAARYGDVLRREVADGHQVETHTWNHPKLLSLKPEEVVTQITDSVRAIEAQTGTKVRMFRPPYGEYNAAVLAEAKLPAMLWDVDSFDWQQPTDDVLIGRVVDQPRPGSIVLQHDIQPNTARTVTQVIDGLLDRGFSLVTVDQLFGGTAPTSGAWRRAG